MKKRFLAVISMITMLTVALSMFFVIPSSANWALQSTAGAIEDKDYVQYDVTATAGPGNHRIVSYVFADINGYGAAAGDYLEYDVKTLDGYAGLAWVDLIHSSGGHYFRDLVTVTDQHGRHPQGDISDLAFEKWLTRKVPIISEGQGFTDVVLATWMRDTIDVNNGQTCTALFKNIAIKGADGTVKINIFTSYANRRATNTFNMRNLPTQNAISKLTFVYAAKYEKNTPATLPLYDGHDQSYNITYGIKTNVTNGSVAFAVSAAGQSGQNQMTYTPATDSEAVDTLLTQMEVRNTGDQSLFAPGNHDAASAPFFKFVFYTDNSIPAPVIADPGDDTDYIEVNWKVYDVTQPTKAYYRIGNAAIPFANYNATTNAYGAKLYLQYSVKILTDVAGLGGIELGDLSGRTTSLATTANLKDSGGVNVALNTNLSAQAHNKWYTRAIELPLLTTGNHYDTLLLALDIPANALAAGSNVVTAYYGDIKIVDANGNIVAAVSEGALFDKYNGKSNDMGRYSVEWNNGVESNTNATAQGYYVHVGNYNEESGGIAELFDNFAYPNVGNVYNYAPVNYTQIKAPINGAIAESTLGTGDNAKTVLTYTPTDADAQLLDMAIYQPAYDSTGTQYDAAGTGAIKWPNGYYKQTGILYKFIIKYTEVPVVDTFVGKPIEGDYIEMTVTVNKSGSATAFTSTRLGDIGWQVYAGDRIEYDVMIFDEIDGLGGIDLGNNNPLPEAAPYAPNRLFPSANRPALKESAYRKWHHVSVDLTGLGYIDKIALASEIIGQGITEGTFVVWYDNIHIVDSDGNILKDVFTSFDSRLISQQVLLGDELSSGATNQTDFVVYYEIKPDEVYTYTLGGLDEYAQTVDYSMVVPAANGTAALSGKSVTYTPDSSYVGLDSFIINQAFDDAWIQAIAAAATPPGVWPGSVRSPRVKFVVNMTETPNNPEAGTSNPSITNPGTTTGTGTITGRLVDENGKGIGGVTLELRPGSATATTDSKGFFEFNNVSAGTYTLSLTDEDGQFFSSDFDFAVVSGQTVDLRATFNGETLTVRLAQPGENVRTGVETMPVWLSTPLIAAAFCLMVLTAVIRKKRLISAK